MKVIQYFDGGDVACVDEYSFRRDKKTGYYLSSKKIGGKRKRLHVYVWEKINGHVPKGMHVHHMDGDKANNEPKNLVLLTRKEHEMLHGKTLPKERRQFLANNVTKNAMPKAKAWHASDEGAKWHSEHAKRTQANLCELEYTCTFCGGSFFSKKRYNDGQNRFCSNRCKSAYRRKTGEDDVIKICEICGRKYTANKYQKTKRCENCKNRKH